MERDMRERDTDEIRRWAGRDVVGSDGKIGSVKDIYYDDRSGQPEWLAVSTGWFGTRVSFVPIAEARSVADEVHVPFTKDTVKDAPHAEADGHLSEAEERRLYAHYGRQYDESEPARRSPTTGTTGTTGRTKGNAPGERDAVTRSEEELDVSTRRHEAGKVRLRKWVDTEHVERSVPVSRDEVRIEREPVTESGPVRGDTLRDEVVEVPLMEEEVVTDKRVTPKERVRVEKDTVTEDQRVEADLRRERVEVTDETADRPRRR
jgi:uncharacterized protein (TIGR02271 family)